MYVTMVITMIIMGAALVPVNTFAVAYLDANAPKSQAALYIGEYPEKILHNLKYLHVG